MSQYISRVLRSSCLRFVATWSFQIRRLSKWSPRYLTVSAWGTAVWLMYTGGQCPRRRVKTLNMCSRNPCCQEGNKLGSMSGTRAISTTARRGMSSRIFSCKARHRRKFTPFSQQHYLVSFLVGLRTYQHPRQWLVCRGEFLTLLPIWLACFRPGRAKDLSAPL